MNIYLIGYRCTGKTSVGLLLSGRTGWQLVDTDQRITAHAGMPVSEIVEKNGWSYFREIEKQVLAETAAASQLVVATGGGIVLDPENRAILENPGHFTVWLRAAPETIEKRMKADAQSKTLRPALTESSLAGEITDTLAARTPDYESAKDLTIDTDRQSVKEICERILKELPDARQHLR
ncbi:MAG TPA: shikimate kinase [Desulfosalsimonadaceae bacterium]|nr:shikimate kinase [Desulfosalsimonadaceae bacterium]